MVTKRIIKQKNNLKQTKKTNTSKISPKKFELALFLLKFILIFAIGTVLINILDLSNLTTFESNIVANTVGSIYVDGKIIETNNVFIITNNCLGLLTITVLAGLIFSTRRPNFEKKVVLFLLGAVFLFLINIPRLLLVVISARLGVDPEFIHVITWYIMSVIALLIWFYGVKLYYKKEPNELL